MHKNIKIYLLQILLFIITLSTTTYAGFLNQGLSASSWEEKFYIGINFSLPFLLILTVHEFGHYFAARLYKAEVSLPYFIPFPLFGFISIGTMGAFIRIKSYLKSNKEIFDIGLAGPLAGFVVAIGILYYGFTHLPPPEYIFQIHPEYAQYGLDYGKHVYSNAAIKDSSQLISVGDNLILKFFKHFVVEDPSRIPNEFEIMHYPFLFAGYVALFFTALNLLPIGQLDGGHILYGLVGSKWQARISPVIMFLLVYVGGMGIMNRPVFSEDFIPLSSLENFLIFSPFYLLFVYLVFSKISTKTTTNFLVTTIMFVLHFCTAFIFPDSEGFTGYLLFSLLVGRFLGVYHPQAYIEEKLDWKRKLLGWLSLIIFILCFTPQFLKLG